MSADGDPVSPETLWYVQRSRDVAPEIYEPRKPRVRCAFCKRWSGHSEMCHEMRESWRVMKNGKHKGKHVSDVPTSYMRFMVDNQYGDTESLYMMLDELVRLLPDVYTSARAMVLGMKIDAKRMIKSEMRKAGGRVTDNDEEDVR